MSELQTLLNQLSVTTNRPYERWKAFLSTNTTQLTIILDHLDSSTLDHLYDIRIVRLIQKKAKSCPSSQNRSFLLTWCKARSQQLEEAKDRRLATFFLIFIRLGRILYWLCLIGSFVSYMGTSMVLDDEQTSFLLSNMWGSFLAVRLLGRLKKRSTSLDFGPIFKQKNGKLIYLLGAIIGALALPSLLTGYDDLLDFNLFRLPSVLRGMAYAIELVLLFLTTNSEFIQPRPHYGLTNIGRLFLLGFLFLIGLPNDGRLFLFTIALLPIVLLFFHFPFLGKPEVENLVKPFRFTSKRLYTLIFCTATLLLTRSIVIEVPSSYAFLSLTILLLCIHLVYAWYDSNLHGKYDFNEKIKEVTDFYLANQAIYFHHHYKNGIFFEKARNNEEHMQAWLDHYSLIESLEKDGLSQLVLNSSLVDKLPAFVKQLDYWNCSYLAMELNKLLHLMKQTDWNMQSRQGKLSLSNLHSDLFRQIDDLYLQQSTLIQWKLYHYYLSLENN